VCRVARAETQDHIEKEHTMSEPTRPTRETRDEERADAQRAAGADREPTPDEEASAEQNVLDPDVVEHEREMAERGARQEGEGRIP
jgi:hypothetical protein